MLTLLYNKTALRCAGETSKFARRAAVLMLTLSEQKRGSVEVTEYDTLLSHLLVFNDREVSETFLYQNSGCFR